MVYSSKKTSLEGHNVIISEHCHIGNTTEVHTYRHNRVVIKAFTTINDNCKIIGNIIIEKYCLLASNIFLSSGEHIAFEKPEFLIKDQDLLFPHIDKTIRIEEDCWIGWGVVIMPGVTIGKGAVIGANAVVTKDVFPYTVNAGIPAKELRKRLQFIPPGKILFNNDNALPYLYRGFALKRAEVAAASNQKMVYADMESLVIMEALTDDHSSIYLKGCLCTGVRSISLSVTINDRIAEILHLTTNSFDIVLDVKKEIHGSQPVKSQLFDTLSAPLKEYTCISFVVLDLKKETAVKYAWGITSIELV